ncbi:hypothetical protein R4036_004569 [Salmonella enterica]|nr:hypothetical protein [Salmonella enterica]
MSDHDLSEGFAFLFEDASRNTTLFVSRAIADLDGLLGEGYATANPAVLAQWLALAGNQFINSIQLSAANGLASQLERLSIMAEAMESSAAAAHAGKMQ